LPVNVAHGLSRSVVSGAAAVGAIAAAAIPAEAEARCWGCSPLGPDEMGKFDKLLVEAWKDDKVRSELQTFKEGSSLNWAAYSAAARTDMLVKTRSAFKTAGVEFPDDIHPVALSHTQFDSGAFVNWGNERVLQIPDRPVNAKYYPVFYQTLEKDKDLAKELASYAINVHICGM